MFLQMFHMNFPQNVYFCKLLVLFRKTYTFANCLYFFRKTCIFAKLFWKFESLLWNLLVLYICQTLILFDQSAKMCQKPMFYNQNNQDLSKISLKANFIRSLPPNCYTPNCYFLKDFLKFFRKNTAKNNTKTGNFP